MLPVGTAPDDSACTTSRTCWIRVGSVAFNRDTAAGAPHGSPRRSDPAFRSSGLTTSAPSLGTPSCASAVR